MNIIRIRAIIFYTLLIMSSIVIGGYRFNETLIYHYIQSDTFILQNYDKPFVYRALSIWSAKLLHYIVGGDTRKIFIAIEVTSLFLSGVFYYKYLRIFFSDQVAKLFCFTLYLIIPFELLLPRFQPLYYPYDTPAILFTILLLHLLYNRALLLYIIVFIVATYNRETTIFMTIITLFLSYSEKQENASIKRRFNLPMIYFSLLQIFIWILIKLSLNQIFINNPGVLFQHQYIENIRFFRNAGLFHLSYIFGNFAFIWVIVAIYWKKLDNIFLKRSVLVIIPFYLSMLYVANIFEYRIFGEMIPIILTPALYLIHKIIIENN